MRDLGVKPARTPAASVAAPPSYAGQVALVGTDPYIATGTYGVGAWGLLEPPTLSPREFEQRAASINALAPTADVPTVLRTAVAANATAGTLTSAVLLRELRIGGVSTANMDLAGDTHFRVKGVSSMIPEPSGASEALFVTAPYMGSTFLRMTYCVETMCYSTAVALKLRSVPTTLDYKVRVNGAWVTDTAVTITGITAGSSYELKFTFPSAAPRRVEIFLNDVAFGGAWTVSTATLTRPTDVLRKRVAFVGDSFTAGSTGNLFTDTFAARLGHLMGADEMIFLGIGGTGWLNAGSTNTFVTRCQIADTMAPDVVILLGSVNDSWSDLPALQAAVTAAVNTLVNVPSVYVSGYVRAGNETGNDRVKAGTLAAGRQFVDLLSLTNGTGRVGATTSNGNADLFVSSDNVHPTQLGHKEIALRYWQGIHGVRIA